MLCFLDCCVRLRLALTAFCDLHVSPICSSVVQGAVQAFCNAVEDSFAAMAANLDKLKLVPRLWHFIPTAVPYPKGVHSKSTGSSPAPPPPPKPAMPPMPPPPGTYIKNVDKQIKKNAATKVEAKAEKKARKTEAKEARKLAKAEKKMAKKEKKKNAKSTLKRLANAETPLGTSDGNPKRACALKRLKSTAFLHQLEDFVFVFYFCLNASGYV